MLAGLTIKYGRIFSASFRYLHQIEKLDRFGGVFYELTTVPNDFETKFLKRLNEIIDSKTSPAVWVSLPMSLGALLPFLSKECALEFHHAEGDKAVLCRWLGTGESKIPRFGTHQVGVAAIVTDDLNKKVLLVQEKRNLYAGWKLPTGMANLNEDIGDAAVREVFEETGINCDFKSIIALRQQHNQPNAFGRSDMLFMCRLIPRDINQELRPCDDEISRCDWMTPQSMVNQFHEMFKRPPPPFYSSLVKILAYGFQNGWDDVEILPKRLPSVHKGLYFDFFANHKLH